MRLLPFISLFLIAAPTVAAPVVRDEGTVRLSTDAEARWVPFDLTPGNQMRFDMTVDGRRVSAILDTGVSHSVLSRRFADAAKLRLSQPETATAIGGSVAIAWTPTTMLALGGLTRSGGRLTVAPLPASATGSATAVDLLVGRDLTAGHALDIDYTNRRFRLIRSGRMPFTGLSAPLTISPRHLVYTTELSLGAGRFRPIVVDTGDGSAITLTARGWQTAALAGVPTTTAISFGLAGSMVTRVAIVPAVRLGTLVAHNVEVRVEPAGGFSEGIGVAGRIGSGFLQHYRVLLDPLAGHMVIAPGPDADKPPVRSTSGLLVGLAHDRLRVLHVMAGGPAAAAGWRDGDEICAIDGAPVTRDYPESPLSNWSAGVAGRIVALTMCDGTTRKLTLRQFY